MWSEAVNAVFEELKLLVVKDPSLRPFVSSGKSFITVDASLKGLGAVSGQWVDGSENILLLPLGHCPMQRRITAPSRERH